MKAGQLVGGSPLFYDQITGSYSARIEDKTGWSLESCCHVIPGLGSSRSPGPGPYIWFRLEILLPCGIACQQCQGCNVAARRIHGLTSISDGRVQEAGGYSPFQTVVLDS